MIGVFDFEEYVTIDDVKYSVHAKGSVYGSYFEDRDFGRVSASEFTPEDVQIDDYYFERIEDEFEIEEGNEVFDQLWKCAEQIASEEYELED